MHSLEGSKFIGILFTYPKFRDFLDILRDCRKSPKITILAISQLIKSITYKHQNYRFRVFRQSLNVSQVHVFILRARKHIKFREKL